MAEMKPEIKFGKIEYRLANAGSKSESVQPFVVEADGTRTQVFLVGDNPFENNGLREFEGREVALSGGTRNGSAVFTVQAVKENPLATPSAISGNASAGLGNGGSSAALSAGQQGARNGF